MLGGALTDRLAVGGYGSHAEVGFQASSFVKSFTTGLAVGGFGLYTIKVFLQSLQKLKRSGGSEGGENEKVEELGEGILEEVGFEIGSNFSFKGKRAS